MEEIVLKVSMACMGSSSVTGDTKGLSKSVRRLKWISPVCTRRASFSFSPADLSVSSPTPGMGTSLTPLKEIVSKMSCSAME